ncbi:hypothetical protein ACI2LF_15000 [Kribbella sp. NPDC020789]
MVIYVCVLLVILAVPLWGLGKTIAGLIKRRKRTIFAGLALICGSIAIEGYLIGAAFVAMAAGESSHGADSSPSPSCRNVVSTQTRYVVGHEAGYLPLHFDCKLSDGTTVPAGVVPKGTTAVVLLAGLATVVLVAAARSDGEHDRSAGASDPYRGSAPA